MSEDQNIFIVRCGEIALKGTNKPYFERTLVNRIKFALRNYQGVEVVRMEGLIFVRASRDYTTEQITTDISRVFGVASISPAVETTTDIETIGAVAVTMMNQMIETRNCKTFKAEVKRADKNYPIPSPQAERIIGAKVLVGCKVLKVDVHNPDCRLFVDIRQKSSFVFVDKITGFGGLPAGTNGKGMILLSGGIDSPVAAFMMAKRGVALEAVHFHSYPYTSHRAQEKVMDLVRILTVYCGTIKIHSVNLLAIQQEIVSKCPEAETTILSRRFMMMIAERLAKTTDCQLLITGENIGQVASQTAEGLVVTDHAVSMPVMRPLIAMDKVDIIEKARKIGTFETSIKPYEDCCTVFLPKHPVTKPKLEKILLSESLLAVEELIDAALQSMETVTISVDE